MKDRKKENEAKIPKPCFVICPFGPPDSQQRKRSNMLLEYVITPAVKEHGYAVIRADISAEPGVVTIHIIQHLIEDDLLVADITDHNPNVFYELAIRHSIRKPFIQLVKEGDNIPFNIQGIQTIEYDLGDPEKIRRAVERIKNQIIYYNTTGKVSSPVSVAIDAMVNTASAEQFQAIMKRLEALDTSVDAVQKIKDQIITEVKSVLEDIKFHVNSEVWRKIHDIEDRIASSRGDMHTKYYERSRARLNYDSGKDDIFSTITQKQIRKGRGEYTMGEWIDILHGKEQKV